VGLFYFVDFVDFVGPLGYLGGAGEVFEGLWAKPNFAGWGYFLGALRSKTSKCGVLVWSCEFLKKIHFTGFKLLIKENYKKKWKIILLLK
jgi:hypothetical protein